MRPLRMRGAYSVLKSLPARVGMSEAGVRTGGMCESASLCDATPHACLGRITLQKNSQIF